MGVFVGGKNNVDIHVQNFVAKPFRIGKYSDGKM